MIDLHTHILPGLDDGAPDLESSMVLIDFLYNLGFKTICATPHYKPYIYDYDEHQYQQAYELLKKTAVKKYSDIKIVLSHEIALAEVNQPHILKWRGIADTGYVLLEPPFDRFPVDNLISTIEHMRAMGFEPIIAHPARLQEFHLNHKLDDILKKMDTKYQLNVGCFSDKYGREVKNLAQSFLKNGRVIGFGSDVHRPDHFKMIEEGLKNLKKLININDYNNLPTKN